MLTFVLQPEMYELKSFGNESNLFQRALVLWTSEGFFAAFVWRRLYAAGLYQAANRNSRLYAVDARPVAHNGRGRTLRHARLSYRDGLRGGVRHHPRRTAGANSAGPQARRGLTALVAPQRAGSFRDIH